MAGGIAEDFPAGALDPAGVVNVRLGVALTTEFWLGIPNGIERREHDAEVVFVRQREKFIHSFQESALVLGP